MDTPRTASHIAGTHTQLGLAITWRWNGYAVAHVQLVDGTLLDSTPLVIAQRSRLPAEARASSGDTSSLVIWVEGGRDIYGVLLNHDGTLSSAGIIPIAVSSSSKDSVEVEFSGQQYAVVWRDASDPAGRRDLYGVRVSAAGNVLDAAPVPLTNYGDIGTCDVAPASSGTWLLAYDRFVDGARRIRARFTNLRPPASQ